MGLLDTLLRNLIGPPTCGDKETLVQPGEPVHVKCTFPPGHGGNHFDSRSYLQWGDYAHDELLRDRPELFKNRP